MRVQTLSIQGMKDPQDTKLVEQALYDVWGVTQVEVSFRPPKVRLSYDDKAASEIDIEQAVIDQGFQVERKGEYRG